VLAALAGGVLPARALAGDGASRPRVSLVVQALDPGAERDAVRIQRLLGDHLRQAGAFVFVSPEVVVDRSPAAAGPAAQAAALLAQGRRAFDTLELARAGLLLGRAAELVESSPASLERELYLQILTYLGATQILLERPRLARESFTRLVLIDPRAALDPVVFPPHLASSFEEVAGAVRRRPQGAVRIEVEPPGAEVWVDGILRGFAPGRVDGLLAGPHFIQLRRLGFGTHGARVAVSARAEVVLRAELAWVPGGGDRLRELTRRLGDEAPRRAYPQVVDELLGWLGSERLFFLRLGGAAPRLRLEAFAYDGANLRRLHALQEELDPGAQGFGEELTGVFTALLEEPAEQGLAVGEGDLEVPVAALAGDLRAAAAEAPPDEDSVWGAWWLWTCVGLVVAGGLALGLALGLPGDPAPTHGEVVFSF